MNKKIYARHKRQQREHERQTKRAKRRRIANAPRRSNRLRQQQTALPNPTPADSSMPGVTSSNAPSNAPSNTPLNTPLNTSSNTIPTNGPSTAPSITKTPSAQLTTTEINAMSVVSSDNENDKAEEKEHIENPEDRSDYDEGLTSTKGGNQDGNDSDFRPDDESSDDDDDIMNETNGTSTNERTSTNARASTEATLGSDEEVINDPTLALQISKELAPRGRGGTRARRNRNAGNPGA